MIFFIAINKFLLRISKELFINPKLMEVNNSLVWFRKSLRIADNLSLSKAC